MPHDFHCFANATCSSFKHQVFQVFNTCIFGAFHNHTHTLVNNTVTQTCKEIHFCVFFVHWLFAFHKGNTLFGKMFSGVFEFCIALGITFKCCHNSFYAVQVVASRLFVQQQFGNLVWIIADDCVGGTVSNTGVLVQLVAHAFGNAVQQHITI